jgi:hypothetical protein
MSQFHLFVEGDSDIKFLQDFIFSQLRITIEKDININSIGGWENLSNSQIVIQAFDHGKHILIIFDADKLPETRRKEILEILRSMKVKAEIFLFPDDQNPGCLEDLLIQIINSKNKPIFDCFEKYESCLKDSGEGYTLPAKKTKVYSYLESLVGETRKEKEKIKDLNRNYKNEDHWDLTHSSLKPLYIFLKNHLTGSL